MKITSFLISILVLVFLAIFTNHSSSIYKLNYVMAQDGGDYDEVGPAGAKPKQTGTPSSKISCSTGCTAVAFGISKTCADNPCSSGNCEKCEGYFCCCCPPKPTPLPEPCTCDGSPSGTYKCTGNVLREKCVALLQNPDRNCRWVSADCDAKTQICDAGSGNCIPKPTPPAECTDCTEGETKCEGDNQISVCEKPPPCHKVKDCPQGQVCFQKGKGAECVTPCTKCTDKVVLDLNSSTCGENGIWGCYRSENDPTYCYSKEVPCPAFTKCVQVTNDPRVAECRLSCPGIPGAKRCLDDRRMQICKSNGSLEIENCPEGTTCRESSTSIYDAECK